MAEVNISMNGRVYEISCDDGQEGRVLDLASYIDQRMQKIARSGAAYNDAHLMVLTSLVLADELFEAQEQGGQPVKSRKTAETEPAVDAEEEKNLVKMLDKLTKRIDGIAARVQAS